MFAVLEVPDLTIAFGFYVVFLLSVTAHEAAHALAAMKLGDPTAYLGGQVRPLQLVPAYLHIYISYYLYL